MTFRNKLTLIFGTALCILLLIGALSYERFLEEDSDHRWIAHPQRVLEPLDASLGTGRSYLQLERRSGTNQGSQMPMRF
jgi:hypothetical protein